jgi:hypothetical protein
VISWNLPLSVKNHPEAEVFLASENLISGISGFQAGNADLSLKILSN